MNQFAHNSAYDHLAVLPILFQPFVHGTDDRVVLDRYQRGHEQRFSYSAVAHLADPGPASYGTSRDQFPQSESYECNYLLNAVTLLKHMELGKDGGIVASPIPGIDFKRSLFVFSPGLSFMCEAICPLRLLISWSR